MGRSQTEAVQTAARQPQPCAVRWPRALPQAPSHLQQASPAVPMYRRHTGACPGACTAHSPGCQGRLPVLHGGAAGVGVLFQPPEAPGARGDDRNRVTGAWQAEQQVPRARGPLPPLRPEHRHMAAHLSAPPPRGLSIRPAPATAVPSPSGPVPRHSRRAGIPCRRAQLVTERAAEPS